MIGLAAHWMVGSIYSAGVGWAVIPRVGWRPFLLLASLPAWLAAAGTAFVLPESPRFLLVSGHQAAALQVRSIAGSGVMREGQRDALAHVGGGRMQVVERVGRGRTGPMERGAVQCTSRMQARLSRLQVLRRMAAWNGRRLPANVALLSAEAGARQPSPEGGRHASGLAGWGSQMSQLLRPPLLAATGPLLVAWVGMCGGW